MNIIRSEFPEPSNYSEIKCVDDIGKILNEYSDFLTDESRLDASSVEKIYFPISSLQVSAILQELNKNSKKIAVSGARTGVVGGAVALDVDCLISLSQMKNFLTVNDNSLAVQAGVSLDELNTFIVDNCPEKFFPVDPTETSASMGGCVSTNASGARTYHYGPTRDWVNSITIVFLDGSMTRIKRGTIFADKCCFRMQFPNRPESRFEFPLHSYPETKNTAGFILTEKMDAIDLFIGSEGILGIITEVEIRLIPKPENRLYTVVWLPDEKQAIKLVSKIKESNRLEILALEYFDKHSIEILKKRRNQEGSSSSIPHLDFKANAAVFFDCIYADENELIEISAEFSSILSNQNLSLDDTWSGLDDSDLRRMKALRHALPETINMIIAERKKQCPDLHKISTDFAVPNDSLNEMLDIYHRAMKKASLEYVIFGHIGNNHLHMNILPKNATELKLAKELYIELAFEAVRLGGTVSAEHGIGRLKRHLMPVQYPPEMINAMRTLKNIFDPKGLLNPGVLLPESNVS